MQRYREIHDFVHTLSGLSTNLVEEVALKWVEMVNIGLPITVLSSIFGPLTLSRRQKVRFTKEFLPWAIAHGKTAKFLLNVYYEKEFGSPIDELREKIGIKAYS